MLPPIPITNAMLVDTIQRRSVKFTYMPQEFSESKAAEWANVNILGRSEPIVSYAWSGARKFNLTLFFVAHGEQKNIETEVLGPVRLIRSWVYPFYSSQQRAGTATRLATPPYVLLIVGTWLRQRCILNDYDLVYRAPWARVDQQQIQLSSSATSAIIVDNFGNPIGEQSIQPSQPETGVSETKDSLIPYVAEMRLTLQEVNENIPGRSPWDTMQVRRGDDKLKDLSTLDVPSPGSNG